LSVQSAATNTLVSWTAPGTGWRLEQYPASGAGAWTVVSAAATQAGGQMQVELPLAAANDFFQLAPIPTLNITSAGANTLAISWPAWATTWSFQQSPALATNAWTAATNTQAQVGDSMQVNV
jgi:hypothetical protein